MATMAKVKLKKNMIFGGAFYSFGTVLDREEVPLNLRKRKYLTEPDAVEAVRLEEEEIDQDIIFEEDQMPMPDPDEDDDEDDEDDEEEAPPPPKKFKRKLR